MQCLLNEKHHYNVVWFLNCDLFAYTINLCRQTEYQKNITGLIVFKLTNDPILQTPGFIILVKHFKMRTVRNSVVLSFRCFIYSQVRL